MLVVASERPQHLVRVDTVTEFAADIVAFGDFPEDVDEVERYGESILAAGLSSVGGKAWKHSLTVLRS